jgi:hypothetical protein
MLKYGIDDIQLFFKNDIGFLDNSSPFSPECHDFDKK